MQAAVPGYFYAEQLTVTQKPKDSDFFLVERVLKTKTIKKKKYYLCKFQFSPGYIYVKCVQYLFFVVKRRILERRKKLSSPQESNSGSLLGRFALML